MTTDDQTVLASKHATVAPDVWTFGSDRADRNLLFPPVVFSHPAKLHLGLLRRILETYTDVGDTLLDPMAGTGSLMLAAYMQRHVILRDIQPEYVAMMHAGAEQARRRAGWFCGLIDIGQTDARTLDCPPFDHILFSPPYGFETGTGVRPERAARLMATPNGRKAMVGHSARAWTGGFRYAGAQANTGNKSGGNYWSDMRLIYARLAELMPDDGLMIVVVKNHYRRGLLKDITGQTVVECKALGFRLMAHHQRYIDNPSLWQRRRREQGLPIVDFEDVLVFGKARRS